MFKNSAVSTFNQSRTPSASGAVVLLKTTSQNQSKPALFASIMLAIFMTVTGLQLNYVYASTDSALPITSPLTSSENPSPSPSASVSPSPSASSNPITSPEVAGSQDNNNNSNNGSNSGNSGSSSGGNGGGTPTCNNQKPASAPKLYKAATGKNEVTLFWEKAKDPVTHYVITYGLKSNQPLYGNSNIGNFSSYTIKGLSGGATYFFKVRASNDCQPGDYSNEFAVKVNGKSVTTPAVGFQPGVLGSKFTKAKNITASATQLPVIIPAANHQTNQPSGLFSKLVQNLFSFFSH